MQQLKINLLEDRIAVLGILGKNGYTVRMVSARKPGSKAYEYYVEYEPNNPKDGEGEGK